MSRILLAGGGTAGHVNPLLAVADSLTSAGHTIFALGSTEGIEKDLVPAAGLTFFTIPKLPLPRRLDRDALLFPRRFLASVGRVKSIIIDQKIQAVVGFGGYVAAPAYAAAFKLKIPFVIHEANAKAGIANILAAPFAKRVGVSVIGALPRGELVGTPIRRNLVNAALRPFDRAEAKKKLGLHPARKLLLIFGGSQGSVKINTHMREILPSILKACDNAQKPWQVLHITGHALPDQSLEGGQRYKSVSYMHNMECALSVADLVVSRAGASTVAEMCLFGLPVIYIPYPFGNGEQRHNVAHMKNAARVLHDSDLSGLEYELLTLMTDDSMRQAMAQAARRFAICNAAQNTAKLAEESALTTYQ